MSNFEKWDKEFRAQNLYAFNNNANALLWLKVRAVCRGKQIDQFLNDNKLALTSTKISEQNVELFELLENRDDAKSMHDENVLRSSSGTIFVIDCDIRINTTGLRAGGIRTLTTNVKML